VLLVYDLDIAMPINWVDLMISAPEQHKMWTFPWYSININSSATEIPLFERALKIDALAVLSVY